jgi:hypothetical protein
LDQLDTICGDRRGDPIEFGRDRDGTVQRTELRNATTEAFDSLQTAAEKLLAK